MKKFLESIFHIGTEGASPSVRHSIIVANYLSIGFSLLLALPYSIMTYFTNAWLTWVPTLCFFVGAGAYFLNAITLNVVGRLLMAILPTSLLVFYSALIIPVGGKLTYEVGVIGMALGLVPFTIFGNEEKKSLIVTTCINALFIFLFPFITQKIETYQDIDPSLMEESYSLITIRVGGILIAFGAISSLTIFLARSRKEINKLLQEFKKKEDEITEQKTELQKTLDEISLNKVEEEKRTWTNKGMVRFVQILRNESGEKMFQTLMAELTHHMRCVMGSIFIVDEQDELYLQIKGSYAYDRSKFLKGQKLMPGEGLVGQCYLEKKSIYLVDVPEGFAKIESGLGETTPDVVLIVPLINEGKVEGVIELGGFNKFADHEIDFLNKLGENVAITIARERSTMETEKLLVESKDQQEKMRQQEEEMLQNMEEMQATQDMVEQKEAEYLTQIKNLEKEIEDLKKEKG